MSEVNAFTYEILEDGRAIKCRVCGYTSHDVNDLRFKYCCMCEDFHENPSGKIKKHITNLQKSLKNKKGNDGRTKVIAGQ